MAHKFKVGDLVRLTGDEYTSKGLPIGSTYPVAEVSDSGGFYLTGKDNFRGYFCDWEAVLVEAAPETTQAPAKLPRLEIQAAPQGGFLVIAPSASMGTMSETLSAHSKLDDALAFVGRAMS